MRIENRGQDGERSRGEVAKALPACLTEVLTTAHDSNKRHRWGESRTLVSNNAREDKRREAK